MHLNWYHHMFKHSAPLCARARWLMSCLKTNLSLGHCSFFLCLRSLYSHTLFKVQNLCSTAVFHPFLKILISSVLWSLLPGLPLCHTPTHSSLNSSTQWYKWSNDGTSLVSVTSILHHRVYVQCLISMYLLFKLCSILPYFACCEDTEMGDCIAVAILPVECKEAKSLFFLCIRHDIYVYTKISLGPFSAVLC